MRIRQVDWDDAGGVALRAAQRAELTLRYNDPNSEPGVAPSASDMTAFFVAYVDDQAVGCGGLRELSGSEAEIKRMFVDPHHRGTGVSTAIVQELESFGRARGWARLVLETGDEQPDAVRFYEREGFTRIPNFGYYAGSPRSLCYEKSLFALDPQGDLVCESCE
jgi:GNAT superfamily N-acetyltransferase